MIAVGAVGRVVENYLAERQGLGYRMDDTELRRFARYADAHGHEGPLDAELQVRWARLHIKRTTAGTATRRLETLRPFVRYYRQFEPGSAVVDPCLLGPKRGRLTPHIYTPVEIDALPVSCRCAPVRPRRCSLTGASGIDTGPARPIGRSSSAVTARR